MPLRTQNPFKNPFENLSLRRPQTSPVSNPFGAAPAPKMGGEHFTKPSGGDQLARFKAELGTGFKPDLRQPALPYTAKKGWNA